MLFPGCFGMVLTILQLARTPKTQYTVYKNIIFNPAIGIIRMNYF